MKTFNNEFLHREVGALRSTQNEAINDLQLTRRRHDMGNSLGNETSCESSTPLVYSTPNVLAPNGQ